MSEDLLVPPPKRLRRLPGRLALAAGITSELRCERSGIAAALTRLESTLADSGVDAATGGTPLILEASASYDQPQGYTLEVEPSGIRILSAGETGLSHGLATLDQWIRASRLEAQPADGLPAVSITDAPSVAQRGVMLDISRSRVPSMDRLFSLIDRLASWKLNQLQLYTEHTFAYRGHETVWKEASPITPAEARQLDEYCRQRHVELIPNQNSFGHLHRWLRHSKYRPLAECPEGIDHPFSSEREPFSLCPLDPGSLDLLDDLYAQLLPNFTSRNLHVGFDETIDLGQGRSRERAAEVGVAGLYSEFLLAVHALAARHGHRVQFWGDIAARHPQILDRLPSDVVVMEWGYEADHPFAERATAIASAGLDFQLCPGTSSWLSLAGRISNATTNIATAAQVAGEHGAGGVMVTDWGDRGHLQPPVVSEPGLLCAAAMSWNAGATREFSVERLPSLLDLHVFGRRPGPGRGPSAGETLITLADLYRLPGASTFNGSPLFYLLTRPDMPLDHTRLAGLSKEGLAACAEVLAGLPEGPADLAWSEIHWIRDAMALAADLGLERLDGGAESTAAELPGPLRRELARRLGALVEEHGRLWRSSSRPGGARESAAVLERARELLLDETMVAPKHG